MDRMLLGCFVEVRGPAVPRDALDVAERGELARVGREIPGADQPARAQPRREPSSVGRVMFASATSLPGSSSVSTSASVTSTCDAVRCGVRACRLDGVLVGVEGVHRREPELGRDDGEHTRAAAEIDQAAALELQQQLTQSCVVGCPPVPNARPGSITIAVASAGGSSQGGPIQTGPTRTGRWNAFQRSRQSAATSSPRAPPKECHSRSSPAASVYAISSTPSPDSTSSKPVGKQLEHAGARRLCSLGGDCDRDAAQRLSGTRSSACRGSPRRARRSRRSTCRSNSSSSRALLVASGGAARRR